MGTSQYGPDERHATRVKDSPGETVVPSRLDSSRGGQLQNCSGLLWLEEHHDSLLCSRAEACRAEPRSTLPGSPRHYAWPYQRRFVVGSRSRTLQLASEV